MLQDKEKLQLLGDFIIQESGKYYQYLNAIFQLQQSSGLRFGDCRLFKNWRYSQFENSYKLFQQKTGKSLKIEGSRVPMFLTNASPVFKEKMSLQSYSKAVKVIKRASCPVVLSLDGKFTITHVFRYLYIYNQKQSGKENQVIANELGIAVSTLNHYLSREFVFV